MKGPQTEAVKAYETGVFPPAEKVLFRHLANATAGV